MLPRFHVKDFAAIGHYLGLLLVIQGMLMLIPVVVAALFGEASSGTEFAFGAGLSCLVGSLLFLLKASRLDRRRSLLLCGFAWVIVAFFAAVPMYLSGDFPHFLDAYFDSVSALTSTGVSCLDDLEHMSYAQVTWRTILSLAGGQVIVITALYLGFFGDGGYSAKDNARARRDAISAALRKTSRTIWMVMALMVALGTVVLMLLCLRDGMPVADAFMNGFWLSGNAFSTGSFVPHKSSLIFYHSTSINAFVAVLMILGSINFAILALAASHKDEVRHSLLRNSELRVYGVWVLLLVVAVSAVICREGLYTSFTGLFNHSTFMVITSATTSGMQTVYGDQMGESFPDGALILIMAAMFIGGCSCSTAGGLKMFRALQVLRWFAQSVMRSLFPNNVKVSIRYQHFGTKRATPGDAQLAMVVTTLFIIAAAFGASVFIANGYEALDAICESISYVTNTGVVVGRAPDSMDNGLKVMAMILMWAGRLEFIALIAAFTSVIASLRPRRNHVPDGVVSSRSSQREENRQGRLRRLKEKLLLEDASVKLVAPLLVVALAASYMVVPHAVAEEGVNAAGSMDEYALEARSYRSSSIAELVSATSRMDGDYVEISGEVIGKPIVADSTHVWLNLREDGGAMISVLARNSQVSSVSNYGGHRGLGDTVTVRGKYNHACQRHSGELEVHATKVAVADEGYQFAEESNTTLSLLALLFLILSFILIVLERRWRGRSRVRFLWMKL